MPRLGEQIRQVLSSEEARRFAVDARPDIFGPDFPNPYLSGGCLVAAEGIRRWVVRTKPEYPTDLICFQYIVYPEDSGDGEEPVEEIHVACRIGSVIVDAEGFGSVYAKKLAIFAANPTADFVEAEISNISVLYRRVAWYDRASVRVITRLLGEKIGEFSTGRMAA